MTNFYITITKQGLYRWCYRFNTRFNPILLYGNSHPTQKDCLNEIHAIKERIDLKRSVILQNKKLGCRFIVQSNAGITIGVSRIFPSQELMVRVLAILQRHLQKSPVVLLKSSIKESSAA